MDSFIRCTNCGREASVVCVCVCVGGGGGGGGGVKGIQLERATLSLVPRPLPDFISQPCRKIGRRPGRTGNGGLG